MEKKKVYKIKTKKWVKKWLTGFSGYTVIDNTNDPVLDSWRFFKRAEIWHYCFLSNLHKVIIIEQFLVENEKKLLNDGYKIVYTKEEAR